MVEYKIINKILLLHKFIISDNINFQKEIEFAMM